MTSYRYSDDVLLLLKRNSMSISFAESCTGGALMKCMITPPGASQVMKGGIVAYTTEIKCRILDINLGMIKQYGVVSSSVSRAMAANVMKKFESHIGVGITGCLGPNTDEFNSPIGIVYMSIVSFANHIEDFALHVTRPRNENLEEIVIFAMKKIKCYLEQ